jgi:MHS family citrate/tricarballylate:H+ symporter-like MFS transporter
LVGVILSKVLTDAELQSYGWRIAFLLGAACLPFGLWLRSRLPETVDLAAVAASVKQASGKRFGTIRANARIISLGLLILASGTITTYVGQYMTTYAETTLHVTTGLAFATSVASNAFGIVGALYGGWLADRAGRWHVMVWPQLITLLLTYPTFLWIVDTQSAWALLGGFGLLSLIGSIPYSAFYVALAEGLPQNIRGGAFATIYAVAIATFGGTAQLVVTWLIHVTGNALAPAWYLLFAAAVGLIAMAMMRETAPGKATV